MNNRILFAVAIALLCIGAVDPSYRAEPMHNTATPFNAHPNMMHEDCYYDPVHDASDLCAQWRAAKAAEAAASNSGWANWLAGLGLLVSAVGMIGVFITVWFTRNALSEARAATRAAEDAVKEARRIGEAQVRCYLAVTEVKLKLTSSDKKPRIQTSIKNFGQSPALNTDRAISVCYANVNTLHKIRLNKHRDNRDHGVVIAPGSEANTPFIIYDFPLNNVEENWLRANELAVSVFVKVTAEDVFGERIEFTAHYAKIRAKYDHEFTLDFVKQ